jgi:hypothetical protein
MSWHRIVFPLTTTINPEVVEIGKIVIARYEAENKPAGFGMFHATQGSEGELDDKLLVYLSPVASELCSSELSERYTLEPCEAPANDEPNIAWVHGDPRVMNQLRGVYQPASA